MTPIPFACPSSVIPAPLKENILFLKRKVSEIALLCFEPSLPVIKDLLPFHGAWHIHLPYLVPEDFYKNPANYTKFSARYAEDTEWKNCWDQSVTINDIETFANTCIRITKHCYILKPKHCILHLPDTHKQHSDFFLKHFLTVWEKELPLELLCLENVNHASFLDYEETILSSSCSLCFDMAHALSYGQTDCLEHKELMEKVKVVHWSAPYEEDNPENGQDKHLNLTHLKNHTDYCINVLKNTPLTATHVLEMFSWEEIEKSKPFFFQLFQQALSQGK
jgi:hypothetical protein